MAIKGNGYVKTTWAFQERPVSSSKLNALDDRVESALELVFTLLNLAWGGGNGVIRGGTANDLKTVEKSPAGLSVIIQSGYGFISGFPYKLSASRETEDFAVPATNPRVDLVQAKLDGWGVSVKKGTEAANPSAPAPDADSIVLAHVYLRPSMTCIKNADDGLNGYIVDARSFL